tara:strand:+ start:193 stop:498 length:306 start_codon:yes stop_codon:yes gene_type:complete
MNTFQIVMLLISGLLVLSVFWEKLIPFFSNIKKPNIKKPEILIKPKEDKLIKTGTTSLTEVVADWEKLKQSCADKKLNQAVKALKNIFPLLVIEEGDEQDV